MTRADRRNEHNIFRYNNKFCQIMPTCTDLTKDETLKWLSFNQQVSGSSPDALTK